MTPLDLAYIAALKDGSKESEFYDTFLNTILYIPTHNAPEKNQERRAEEDESISPIFIESEGVQHLMLFDTETRLSDWAQREVGYVALPGHAVVEMMSLEFHWALNIGTENDKTFEPDEIEWLKSSVAKSKGVKSTLSKDTTVLIGAPAFIPDGLIDSFTKSLLRNVEVKRAYLGQVHYVEPNEKPHLALVIDVTETDESILAAIRNDLGVATKGYLGSSEHIDIMLLDSSSIAKDIAKAVEPFYVSK